MPDREQIRHRWTCGVRKGRWLPTRSEAIEAAIRAGVASRDEHTGNVYWGVMAGIEREGE